MIKRLYAVDEQGSAVPGASFVFSFIDNGEIIETHEAGTGGFLSLDTAWHPNLFVEGVHVRAIANGYETAGVDTFYIPDEWEFIMPKKDSTGKYLLLGGGIAALLVAVSQTKKKKVGAVDVKRDVLPWVVPAAVVVGGYLVYNQFFGERPDEAARDNALDAAIAAEGTPTLSEIEMASIANSVYEDIQYSWISNDLNDAVRQLCRVKNTADILGVIKAYGRRTLKTFGIPRGSFTLEESVASQLGTGDKDFVNRYYDAQGINFNF